MVTVMAGFGKRRAEDVELEQEQVEGLLGFSVTQLALGIGVLGILGAVFFTPILDNGARLIAGLGGALPNNVDPTVTGTVQKPNRTKRYIIRRSVMNPNPKEPCYIYEDGSREGNC